MLNTDDDDFFTPITSSSSLAGLFGNSGSKDTSLTYTPPKQPKSEPDLKPQNKLICVKTIRLYKVVNDAPNYTGKYGLAIVGDDLVKSYDLIIYKTKQQILSTTKITSATKFTPLNSQFLVQDDQNQSWYVQFKDVKEQAEFLGELSRIGVDVKSKSTVKKMGDKDEPVTDEGCFSDGTRTQARADILQRISKVGQSMLPNARSGDISESESDEVVKTKKVIRKPKRHSASDKETFQTLSMDIPESNPSQFMVPVSPNVMQPYQYIPNQMMQCIPTPVLPLNDPFSIYFAENRTHNSEVRMNLSHLSNRLESVLSELTHIKTEKADETSGVLFKKIEELEKKLEKSSNVEEKSDESLNLEELERLKNEIKIREATINELRDENASLQTTQASYNHLSGVNKELTSRLDNMQQYYERNKENETTISSLHEQINDLKSQLSQVNTLNQTLLLQNDDLNHKLLILNQDVKRSRDLTEEKLKEFADSVKEKMNAMYQNIIEKFIDFEAVSGNQVKRELSLHMKRTTFQIIEASSDRFKVDDGSAPPVPEFEVTV